MLHLPLTTDFSFICCFLGVDLLVLLYLIEILNIRTRNKTFSYPVYDTAVTFRHLSSLSIITLFSRRLQHDEHSLQTFKNSSQGAAIFGISEFLPITIFFCYVYFLLRIIQCSYYCGLFLCKLATYEERKPSRL